MSLSSPSNCHECKSHLKNIFCGVNGELADLIDQHKITRTYRRKQILYYEKTPITGIFCIKSGEAKVFKTGSEGKQHILRIVHGDHVLGLESLFAGEYFQSAAEMIEDGVVCLIQRQAVLEVIRRNPQASMQIMQALAAQAIASDTERVDLAQNSVRERMARLLSLLAESHGQTVKNGILINLSISREEIAEMVGTAAETAMRLLKEFREDKLVEVHGKEILILDRRRLADTAHLEE